MLYDTALSSKKRRESEAQKLFDSINDYVLEELDIKLPELKDQITYIINSEDAKDKRIDSYYYQPKFDNVKNAINKSKYGNRELSEIIESLINGFDYREFTDKGVIYLRVSNIRPNRFRSNLEICCYKTIYLIIA